MISRSQKAFRLQAGLMVALILFGWVAVPELAVADDCPDAWITTKVTSRLVATEGIGIFKINVDTRVCVVTLRGCVDTQEHKAEAGRIARNVKKVREVKNKLTFCEDSD